MNIINSESDMNQASQIFLNALFAEMQMLSVDIKDHWDIDHICYRVENFNRYLEIKKKFLSFSELLTESEVNGRPISTFQLYEPIRFRDYEVFLVEVPAPKPNKNVREGFEHIEFVCDVPFDVLSERFSHLEIDASGLNKNFNQEFEIILKSGAIKFHHLSLKSVVEIEKNKKVWDALKQSNILESLKDLMPLIAGTYPLGIHNNNSDLDILLFCNNLEYLKVRLIKLFGNEFNFQIDLSKIDGLDTLIAQFNINEVTFELFAQNQASVLQRAYLHFLAEEKILKYAGQEFLQKIIQLKQQTIKTEPAFANLLNIEGDPFAEILHLEKMPITKLKHFLKNLSQN